MIAPNNFVEIKYPDTSIKSINIKMLGVFNSISNIEPSSIIGSA